MLRALIEAYEALANPVEQSHAVVCARVADSGQLLGPGQQHNPVDKVVADVAQVRYPRPKLARQDIGDVRDLAERGGFRRSVGAYPKLIAAVNAATPGLLV